MARPTDNPKTTQLQVRVPPDEKSRWARGAEAAGVSLSELVRRRMNGETK